MNEVRKLAWHHFVFRIPVAWETTAYSVEDREGRIEFSTRHGFTAVVSWEPCKTAPDVETMMIWFLRKHRPSSMPADTLTVGNLTTKTVGRFLLGYDADDQIWQAMSYLNDERVLLRWIWAASRDPLRENVRHAILESFEPNRGDFRDFSLFGLNLRLPREFVLEDMAILPANVAMSFENNKRVRVTFHRWGMPELATQGASLETFYPRFLQAQGCRIQNVQTTTVADMPAVQIRFEQRGQHKMDTFMGRFWNNGEACLWHNRTEQRLYAFEQIGPEKAPLLKREEVWLS
jgi:hypothetical protein